MKLLLALSDDELYKRIADQVKSLGFETVRYTHIPKAMDNLEEIDPDGIIISAGDFPRHWKIMARFAGGKSPVILLAGVELSAVEAAKARHLGVDVIAGREPDNTRTERLKEILNRSKPLDRKRQGTKEIQQRFSFVFTVPGDITLVTGQVKAVSSRGLSFLPGHTGILKQLKTGTEFSDCSLRAGDTILSPVCRIVRADTTLSIDFVSFKKGEQEKLDKALNT